jgi:hypothetical protein
MALVMSQYLNSVENYHHDHITTFIYLISIPVVLRPLIKFLLRFTLLDVVVHEPYLTKVRKIQCK